MAVRTRRQRRGADPPLPAAPPPLGLRLLRTAGTDGALQLDVSQSYLIGRGANCDVLLQDEAVSRVHAQLKFDAGGWWLSDAQSVNGTFIARGASHDAAARALLFGRGTALAPGALHPLAVGDVVFCGDAQAALVAVDALPDAPQQRVTFGARGTRYQTELARAARGKGPVLLIGASGAGKTWAARTLHTMSGRPGRFVVRNAAALPHDPAQLRSALLGHKKGAFTGATEDVEGAWFAAANGTLFLDEIDSLPPPAQAFLLTLLEQSGDLSALGAAATAAPRQPVDVRVVAASKTPLAQTSLRTDLAYRLLDGAIVEVPTLAERREDIPALVAVVLDELRTEDGSAVPLGNEAVAAVAAADWPGEVRQLRGAVRLLSRTAREEGRAEVGAAEVQARVEAQQRALGTARPLDEPGTTTTPLAGRAKSARALTKADVEQALNESHGNLQHAANALGVARNTLLSKMTTFGVPRPSGPGPKRPGAIS